MGHYGALPPAFARVSPRFFTPGYATIVSAIVASAFYAVMRVVSENTLWDTILTLGMMICFYYGITAFACVWYFRKQWFDSVRNVFFTFLFPLVGGVILAILFFTTLIDSMDPAYGSGERRRRRDRLHPRHAHHRGRHRLMIWQSSSAPPSSAARRWARTPASTRRLKEAAR
jgi:amino acid transporter